MRIGVMLRHLRQHEGGVKVYTLKLLEHLLAIDGDNEYVLLYNSPELLGTYAGRSNVEERVVRMPSKLLWDQVAVPLIARRARLDLIFNPKFSVPLLTSRRSVFVLQGSDWFVMPWNQRWHDRINHKTLTPLYCRKADAIISVSNSVKRDVVAHVGVPGEKVKIVHYGLDERLFRPVRDPEALASLRQKYSLPRDFLLFVGQVYPAKNFGGILRAFARLRGRIPHKLVVAGEVRWKYAGEVALIQELGLEGDVAFTGWVPQAELPAFYSLAGAFLFPSVYEGFGMPLLEAMACGCPIVTATTGSPPEVVDGAALLADPADDAAIAEATYRVVSNPVLREQLVERGLRRARDFSWEKCARETLEVLTGLNGSPADGASGRGRSVLALASLSGTGD